MRAGGSGTLGSWQGIAEKEKRRSAADRSVPGKGTIAFLPVIIPVILLGFCILSFGCTAKEKISETQAVQVALDDPAVLKYIDNQSYVIRDISVTHLSTGSASPVELYSVTIDLQKGSPKRIVAFVTYQGTVMSVETAYPPPKPPSDLINASLNRSLTPSSTIFIS